MDLHLLPIVQSRHEWIINGANHLRYADVRRVVGVYILRGIIDRCACELIGADVYLGDRLFDL